MEKLVCLLGLPSRYQKTKIIFFQFWRSSLTSEAMEDCLNHPVEVVYGGSKMIHTSPLINQQLWKITMTTNCSAAEGKSVLLLYWDQCLMTLN